jgi:hypothetical protein
MSRMIDLIRVSALPSNLMMAASKGSLSVPPREMIEILVHLATHNKVFGQQAQLTLAGWDATISRVVAADRATPKEVLGYMISPKNLRPVLLPSLLENPSVSEDSIAELAAGAARDIIEIMLKSERVRNSPVIQQALRSNARTPTEANVGQTAEIAAAAPAIPPPEPAAAPVGEAVVPTEALGDEVLPEPVSQASEPEDVLDEGILAYLSEHAKEIADEGNKAFQPIGGIDELAPSSEEPLTEAAEITASAAGAATAAARARTALVKKVHLSQNEERGSALQKISKLDVKGRIQLAMKGNKEERSLLVRDGTKVVALAVLESPKISDAEVEKFATQKNVLEAVLRGIPMKRRFAKNYIVIRNLVFNPRAPLDVSLTLVKNLLISDLRNLSGNKEVSDTVRKLALKMFKQKMEAGSKKS